MTHITWAGQTGVQLNSRRILWCSPRGSCGGAARVDDLQGQLRARKRKKTKGLQRASGGGAGTHLACLSCRERANVDVFGYKKNKVHGVVICTWPSTFAFPGEAAAAPLTCVFTWNMRSARSTQLRPERSVLCTQRMRVSLYLLPGSADQLSRRRRPSLSKTYLSRWAKKPPLLGSVSARH